MAHTDHVSTKLIATAHIVPNVATPIETTTPASDAIIAPRCTHAMKMQAQDNIHYPKSCCPITFHSSPSMAQIDHVSTEPIVTAHIVPNVTAPIKTITLASDAIIAPTCTHSMKTQA